MASESFLNAGIAAPSVSNVTGPLAGVSDVGSTRAFTKRRVYDVANSAHQRGNQELILHDSTHDLTDTFVQ
jgi:hypothetical protein